MANSLSDWLADKIASCIASCEVDRGNDQQDRQSLLGDIPFAKGLQVQILRFFTPQVAQRAHHELLDSYHKGLGSQHSQEGISEAAESGPLCAVVADKAYSVHVQISRHCVARFNSTHARSLISLRGSIMHIKSFRPSISFLPSLLDNIQRRDGPFAPELSAIRPILLLEIESMQIVGAINEVQFWQHKELQYHLLKEDTPATPFKRWFKKVEKIMRKEQRKRVRHLEDGPRGKEASQGSKRSLKSSSESDTISAGPASVEMPPPFQRPPQHKRPLLQSTSQQSASTSSQKSKHRTSKSAWGDFVLTQGDEDEFGLEAAASQLIERHEQGYRVMEGQMTAESLDAEADAILRSFSESEFMSDQQEPFEDAVARSGQKESGASQSSKERLSQSSTIPATYPSVSFANTASQHGSDFVTPPKVADSTSLPFSLGGLPSYPDSGAILQSADGSYLGHSSGVDQASQAAGDEEFAVYNAALPLPSVKRESAAQTMLFKDVSMATDPVNDTSKITERITQGKPWNQLRGLPTAEEMAERKPSFSSRLDLIID